VRKQDVSLRNERGSSRNSILLSVVLVLNAIVVGGGGVYLWRQRQKVVKAEAEASPKVDSTPQIESSEKTMKIVLPFEPLLTNLSGDNGRRILRLSLEVEFEGTEVLTEIPKLKPQLRDVILGSIADFSYEDATKATAREDFKQNIMHGLNLQLKKSKAINVYFQDFQTN